MYISRGSAANDAQVACFRGSVSRNRRRARSSSLPAQHQARLSSSLKQQRHHHHNNNARTCLAHRRTANPDFTCSTTLVRPSHLPQHHNISFCPQNFDIHPHSGVPLRRLTHINFTCTRLHHPPIATLTTLHSLRVSTTSSQQPIRLAGDTRPPPA
jgi:hypothetical protein